MIQRESGDLWGIFGIVDSVIDNVENSLSLKMGSNKGHRALQIILLMLPVLVLVILFAAYLLLGSWMTQSNDSIEPSIADSLAVKKV